jgi:hypothetical protein
LCARHEALRTAYRLRGGRLVRHVLDRAAYRQLEMFEPGTTTRDAVARLRDIPMDLATGDLLHAGLVGDELILALHHITFDGACEDVMVADLADAYAAVVAGQKPARATRRRPPPPALDPARRAELERHWCGQLHDVPDLPGTTPWRMLAGRPLVEHPVAIDPATAAGLRAAARARAVSPFGLLMAAYARAVGHVCGAEDFCVGTAVANRPPGYEREVGCFFGMVPVRVRTADPVESIWTSTVDAILHADLPLEQIVRAARPVPSTRMPLYQATLLYQNWPRTVHHAGAVRMRALPLAPTAPQAEILLEVYADDQHEFAGVLQAPADDDWAPRLSTASDALSDALFELVDPRSRP